MTSNNNSAPVHCGMKRTIGLYQYKDIFLDIWFPIMQIWRLRGCSLWWQFLYQKLRQQCIVRPEYGTIQNSWEDSRFVLELSNGFFDDVIKWKLVLRYWPFVRGIHRSPVNSPHNGHWRRILIFSMICAWTNGLVNNRDASNLRRHRAHFDVTVMQFGRHMESTVLVYIFSKPFNDYSWFNTIVESGYRYVYMLSHLRLLKY